MCGIFALLNNYITFSPAFVEEKFDIGKNRGPEISKISQFGSKSILGFHRLAINGLNPEANQPMVDGDIILICNGEIYNYRELFIYMKLEPKTESDCEVIIHLYRRYGIDHTLQMLDGVFSFILIDNRGGSDMYKLYVARDPYGVRPLYSLQPAVYMDSGDEKENIIAFASELKVLYPFYSSLVFGDTAAKKKTKKKGGENEIFAPKYVLSQFLPGTYSCYHLHSKVFSYWSPVKTNYKYHSLGFNSIMYSSSPQYSGTEIVLNVQRYLIRAIEKRCYCTERPMACLLSGGLDSSIVTGLVWQYHVSHNLSPPETYSIGLENSEDLKYARMVADHLKTKHTEIVLKETDFLDAIPTVIRTIESYDTTTVRASIGNYLLGKYISENSNAKVIFNGDGSDELLGGYLYMYMAPESIEFDCEVRRLLNDIYMYDVLRSDKSISSHGLEPRTPFLDRAFVQYYLSIPQHVRFHTRNEQCEKYYLRLAFCGENYRTSVNTVLLPDDVLWRTKEAFSDGVSVKDRSLFQIIQEFATEWFHQEFAKDIPKLDASMNIYEQMVKIDPVMKYVGNHLVPKTAEQYYYRWIFEKEYPSQGKLVPYFWMPKYIEGANDPSARTLDIYNAEEEPPSTQKPDITVSATSTTTTTTTTTTTA